MAAICDMQGTVRAVDAFGLIRKMVRLGGLHKRLSGRSSFQLHPFCLQPLLRVKHQNQ